MRRLEYSHMHTADVPIATMRVLATSSSPQLQILQLPTSPAVLTLSINKCPSVQVTPALTTMIHVQQPHAIHDSSLVATTPHQPQRRPPHLDPTRSRPSRSGFLTLIRLLPCSGTV
ncbi:hypothetical protein BKA80DRAFT_68919 [Phyllosticta citrichinensis]